MVHGSKLKQKQRKRVTKHTHTSRLQSQSSDKHVKITRKSQGNARKSLHSLEVHGSKNLPCGSLTNQTKQEKPLLLALNKTLEIVESRYNTSELSSIGTLEAFIASEREFENSQIEQWTPLIYHVINLHPVYGMEREDLEQELKVRIVKCLHGYRLGSNATFQSYLYKAMLTRLMVLRSKESRQFKVAEKVMYNTSEVTADQYAEIEILGDKRYTSQEKEIMKAAMHGHSSKDIREIFGLSIKDFNKMRRIIADKWMEADPELVLVHG